MILLLIFLQITLAYSYCILVIFQWCFNNTVVYKRGLQTQSPLCIQDPFELNHNVTRNVDSATLGKIKKLCSEAVGVCANFQNPKKERRTNLLHLLDIKIKASFIEK